MSLSSTKAVSRWITCYEPRPHARIRLFCFPHGGGGPQIYKDWAQGLGEDIEVYAVSLPGRGSRRGEEALRSMDALAEKVSEAFGPHLDKPYAMFGHSVGALAAYETACRIRDKGLLPPVRLLLSAHKVPRDSREENPMYALPDEVLLEKIRELGLVPDDALRNKELVDFILPPLKADFELSETYEFEDRPPLPVPLTAMGGRTDTLLEESDLDLWRSYTTEDFAARIYDGDHFYTVSRQDEVLGDIAKELAGDLERLPVSVMEGEKADYPRKCLHEMFRDQAEAHPDRIAVADPRGSLTFRELDEKTDLLARYLQMRGVVVDSLVGIYMPSAVEYVIAYLAILKAGGAYMPLETAYPDELLRRVLEKAKPVVVLTDGELSGRLPPEWRTPEKRLALDEGWEGAVEAFDLPGLDEGREKPGLDSLAYCVMTSGTTGTPKGIICPHRGAVNSYTWRYRYHPYEEGEREACNIFLVWEVIRPLLQGRPSYVIPDDVIYDPWKLVEFLEEHEITRVLFTPSLLEQVFNTPGLDMGRRLKNLKIVWLNGEVVPTALRNRFFENLPRTKLLNDYSISECHDVCTHDLADLNETFSPKYASLGLPMSNVRIYLLDDELHPVPRGMPAEIYIGGDSLARGYLDEPEKTAERFIPDPVRKDGSLVFRTGDMGRILPNGELEVTGRVEFMVKLRGYSIVPGAVEAAINEHEAVKSSVVVTKDSEETGQPEALAAYVVAHGSLAGDDLGRILRPHLKDRLPHYAVPTYFVPIDELPLHEVTGKLDRKKLPPLTPAAPGGTASAAASGSELEREVIAAWEEVLGVRAGSPDDNFFDLGGHSLSAIRICDVLAKRLGVEVSVVDVFEEPTVRALAGLLESKRGDSGETGTSAASAAGRRTGAGGNSGDLAIVGMAGRFPGAGSIDEFWSNLTEGVCSIRELSDEELAGKGVPEEIYSDEDYRKVGALLDEVDLFDPQFWNLSKKEAILMDPQHRLFLECCWQALEHAGYAPGEDGGRTGVFGGCYSPLYLLHNLAGGGFMDPSDPTEFHLTETGNDKDYIATRVSYLLDLRGPSVSVQTSCSTSASVVATACQSLRSNQCDTALAGASSITFPQGGYQYVEGHISSRDGKVRTFDEKASGTILGDGVGVVVLKRLEDALEAGDTVYSVIKGYAVNNDGHDKAGYSAPGVKGQKEMVARALEDAGVSADSIGYLEAHGTGTLVGDPIEIRALTDVYRTQSDRKGYCALGSVKPNIGHSNIAAGMAGLIKASLGLYHAALPPSIHFDAPNPAMDIENSPFFVNTVLRPWTAADGGPRRAGVSCLGIGGTNGHFVLEEPPRRDDAAGRAAEESGNRHLLLLSGKTPEAAIRGRDALRAYLEAHPDVDLGDAEYTLREGRRHFPHRLAVPCSDLESALAGLSSAKPAAPRFRDSPDADAAGLGTVFLFPGQGSQHNRMGYGVYENEPVFRGYFDRCCEILEPELGVDLRRLVFAPEGSPEAEEAFSCAYHVQPAIFSLQYSLARTLMDWGVVPDALAGHSIGEYAAACVAGIFGLEDALKLVTARGRVMESAGEGAMLAARMGEEEAAELAASSEGVSLALINSPTDMVFSGPVDAIGALEADLESRGTGAKRVNVRQAFHSAMMDAPAAALNEVVAGISLNKPSIRLASNLTGTWMTDEQALDPRYWGRQMRGTVRFSDDVATLLEERPKAVLEVGSHTILGRLMRTFVRNLPEEERPAVISCLRHPKDEGTPDIRALDNAVGAYWAAGGAVEWTAFRKGTPGRRIGLPGYSFERERCWKNAGGVGKAASPAGRTGAGDGAGKIEDIAARGYIPSWARSARPAGASGNLDGREWLVFTGDDGTPGGEIGGHLIASLAKRGASTTVVRPSDAAARAGGNASAIDPGKLEDYVALLENLHEEKRYPDRILFLWSLGGTLPGIGDEAEAAYVPALNLAKALAVLACPDPVRLWFVTDETVQVDRESVRPEKSTLLGPSIVLPQENRQMESRILDIRPSEAHPVALSRAILAEAAAPRPDHEPIVALRGDRRWVQRYERAAIEPVSAWGESALREGGVYVITGGLGRIAGAVSRRLAGLGAKLVLSDQVDFPAKDSWTAVLGDPKADERTVAAIRRLRELEEAGAEVLVAKNDMGSCEEAESLLETAVERFGRVNGIIHLAGAADLRYLPDMTEEVSRKEFRPKIHGVRNLEKAISAVSAKHGEKPDFVLLFSSLASILGGFSMTAYTAANRFMDAFVQADPLRGGVRWYCANWDDWDFEYTKEQVAAYERTTARFAMTPEEGVETIERIVSRPDPLQILVATRPMEPRVEQWLHQGLSEDGAGTDSPEDGTALSEEAAGGLEERMLEVYRDVLGIPDLGADDDFFGAGGDSLLAGQILLKLRRNIKEHAGTITLGSIFDCPSVRELAGRLDG